MRMLACTVAAGVVLSLCVATLAAPAQVRPQQGADRPGVVTQPRVTVENRGRNEAIPVSIQEWGVGDRAILVQVAGLVETHQAEQTWMYRTVRVRAGEDIAAALTSLGDAGWEATGNQMADPSGGINVLMKHHR